MAQALPSMMGRLTGPAKLAAVKDLVDKLTKDLESVNLQPRERDAALEELKIYGRDPNNADPIFTKGGVETLTRHAFDSSSSTTSQNALRVLCNTLLLKPETRQIFVDLGYEPKACAKLKSDNRDDEFLVSRIIFLTTYGTNVDLPKLIQEHHLADSVAENLARHAKRMSTRTAGTWQANPMDEMALVETLKLLFNITNFATGHLASFGSAIPHVVTLLCELGVPASQTPLDPVFSQLINALLNLDLSSETAKAVIYPKEKPDSVAVRLIHLLDVAMKSYSESQIEQSATPLVCVLSKLYDQAPQEVRGSIQRLLLPTEGDRESVLGQSDTLHSRLLRNWTNPLAPEFRKIISSFYFALSDKDASKLVENVGYGYASGFLFQHGIPVPESATSGAAGSSSRPINPITGQFLDTERPVEMPEMTDEEKEREAERLFVLFERLRSTGVVQVENPVRTAAQEGRFEELSDSDDDTAKDLD